MPIPARIFSPSLSLISLTGLEVGLDDLSLPSTPMPFVDAGIDRLRSELFEISDNGLLGRSVLLTSRAKGGAGGDIELSTAGDRGDSGVFNGMMNVLEDDGVGEGMGMGLESSSAMLRKGAVSREMKGDGMGMSRTRRSVSGAVDQLPCVDDARDIVLRGMHRNRHRPGLEHKEGAGSGASSGRTATLFRREAWRGRGTNSIGGSVRLDGSKRAI